MAASSSAVRHALSASQRALARQAPAHAAHAVRRRSMSTAAMALPLDGPLDLPIFDIFDAPSRLGESSKMLADAARSRPERVVRPSAPSSSASSARANVAPLPTPTVFDGPARPRGLAAGPRVRLLHSRALPFEPRTPPAPLPPPVVFEGPSRLRPYTRDRSPFDDDSTSFTTLLVGAAAASILGLTAWSKVEEKAERIKMQRAQRRAAFQQDFLP